LFCFVLLAGEVMIRTLRNCALFLLCLLPLHSYAAAPACWPDLTAPTLLKVGSATDKPELGEVVYAASSIGLVWGYACTTDGGKIWHKVIVAGAWSAFPADWLAILDTALRGTDADRTALWNKYATANAWDSRLQSDLDKIWALIPNPPPAPPAVVWKVLADPFRTDKKRPIYNVAQGKRGTSTGRYIDAGQPCDPVTTITEYGGVTFLSVQGNATTVARCIK
jgi:hypothetical protein